MTAIIKTGTPSASQIVIPPLITTLEGVTGWGLRGLWELHKNSDFFPDKDLPPVRRVQRTPFVNGQGLPSVLYSVYFTYDSSYEVSGTGKEWLAINEISTAVPSTNFNT